MTLLPKNTGIGWLPYAWLAFLGFFIVGMFVPPVTGTRIFLNLATLAIFLVTFFRCYWIDHGKQLAIPISIIVILGVSASIINPGASVLFHYASFFAGRLGNLKHSVITITVILILIVASWYFGGHRLQYLFSGGLVSLALGIMGTQIYRSDMIQRQLNKSEAERKELAVIAERERIARDLHDIVGHALTVVSLKSQVAHKMVGSDPDQARNELDEISTIASDALSEVRKTINDYRLSGIQSAIDDAEQALKAAGIKANFQEIDIPQNLASEHEQALSMVLKETVTNVIRHSHATACEIVLHNNDEQIMMTVNDNGSGFESQDGNGLKGIRERISSVNGILKISNKNGTRIKVSIPTETANE